jgi:predicted membrane channel-forming protein YqfA (hemolysin III family)
MKKNSKLHTMLEKFIWTVMTVTLICCIVFIILFAFDIIKVSELNMTLFLILSIFIIILFGEIVLKKNHDKED